MWKRSWWREDSEECRAALRGGALRGWRPAPLLFVAPLLVWTLAVLLVDSLTSMPVLDNLEGFVNPRFERVEKVFRKNFFDGWEREGAAVAVYHKGELVVDLQGGFADRSSGRKWTRDTRTVVFSTTKAVGALCVALLVDRGLLDYNDRLAQYFPEFAQNGKENITILQVMSHQAGLAAFDEPITWEAAFDHVQMAAIIAKQKPNWEPGTKSGYHAITFGWLVDQIVRHVDPQGRSVGQFFREEIALPNAEEHTVSRISVPPTSHLLKEILYDPRVLIVLGILHLRPPTSIARKVRDNPQWFKLEQGHGFLYERHPLGGVSLLNVRKIWQDRWLVGHPGYGGSTVMFDMEEDVVIAYVSNGLKTGMGELTRTYRMLRNAVFECL